jgi:hypothetical protein
MQNSARDNHEMPHVERIHQTGGRRPKRWRNALVAAIALGALAAPTAAAADDSGRADLGKVRAATARYHRVEVAEKAGHQLGYIAPFLLDHCIANPTAGAMGYHWFNHDKIHDVGVDPLNPEGLVYEPGPNGQLKLVAVEWIVPAAAWHAAGNAEPPSVLGHEMHILNPALGWYILHAWVWKHNPAGMFEDWNPEVVCP